MADQQQSSVGASMAPGGPGGAARSVWILDRRKDVLFFIATPVLILPAAALALREFSILEISVFVAAFGALGHHLPGMLRAYGDRELFQRFRIRFILAPIFLVSICLWFAHRDLSGLVLMLLVWGIWHGLAQVYGFLRIYDAKVGSVSPWTPRLDMWMCVAWFGVGVFNSPDRMAELFERFYDSGVPLIAGSAVHGFVGAWNVGTGVVTAAFLAHTFASWRRGRVPAPGKLLVMAASYGFWCYAMLSSNVILGIAMFEIFHDVQYLAIVWVYNRKRLDQGHRFGAWMEAIFRPRIAMLGAYVGVVFLYGSFGYISEWTTQASVVKTLAGLVTASTFLHFYYDGFIWKVRERATRAGLGIGGGREDAPALESIPGWVVHGARWAAYVIPAVVLVVAEGQSQIPAIERAKAVLAAAPESSIAESNLGIYELQRGEVEVARVHFERAIRLRSDNAQAHLNLGAVHLQVGRSEQAALTLEKALRVEPRYAKAHSSLGRALVGLGQIERAQEHFERAERIDSRLRNTHMNVARSWVKSGELKGAAMLYESRLESQPEFAAAHFWLGFVSEQQQEPAKAKHHYQRTLAIEPGHARAQNSLAWLLATSSDAGIRDGEAAVGWARSAAEATRYQNLQVLDTLAAAYAEAGQFDEAVRWQAEALKLASAEVKAEFHGRMEQYQAGQAYREAPLD